MNLKNTDIYLIDQILKERFSKDFKILDAGCGSGRNMTYFMNSGFDITGIDIDKDNIKSLQEKYKNYQFKVSDLKEIPFLDKHFNYIICNAVLHFANNTSHFFDMFTELFRVLKPNGTLFIRMTSDIGIENKVTLIKDGVYKIPDGSTRFLVTKPILEKLQTTFSFTYIEPLKTVNVNDLRCMSTLVLKKQNL